MSKQTLIVIGNGMVGHHFLEQFTQSPAAAVYQVIVFGEEKQLAYDRVAFVPLFRTNAAPPDQIPRAPSCRRGLRPERSPP